MNRYTRIMNNLWHRKHSEYWPVPTNASNGVESCQVAAPRVDTPTRDMALSWVVAKINKKSVPALAALFGSLYIFLRPYIPIFSSVIVHLRTRRILNNSGDKP